MNLFNEASDSKLVTKKWSILNDKSNAIFDIGYEIIHNTEVLKYNLCDCSDAYILVRVDITVTAGHWLK